MNKFSDIELEIILAHYLFKNCQMPLLVQRLKQSFHKDYNETDLIKIETLYKILDPSNNRDTKDVDSSVKTIWEMFSTEESRKDLKQLYNEFNNNLLKVYPKHSESDSEIHDYKSKFIIIDDQPKPLSEYTIEDGKKKYKRSQDILNNALALAEYRCEADCKNVLFYRKDGKEKYTEGHHLIPLSSQDNFKYSLDVEANIVSLCPMCHRLLHHGLNNSSLLKKLYDKRITRLKKCNIDISFEQLLDLYN